MLIFSITYKIIDPISSVPLQEEDPRAWIIPELSDYSCSRRLLTLKTSKIPDLTTLLSTNFHPSQESVHKIEGFCAGLDRFGLEEKEARSFQRSPIASDDFDIAGDLVDLVSFDLFYFYFN